MLEFIIMTVIMSDQYGFCHKITREIFSTKDRAYARLKDVEKQLKESTISFKIDDARMPDALAVVNPETRTRGELQVKESSIKL